MSSVHPLRFVDTHCHLNFDEFDADRIQVVDRARSIGIRRILIPGIDIETSESAIKLSLEFPEIYAAIGVHPNSSMAWEKGTLNVLRQLARERKVVAIGEIGLDYYRDYTPKETQLSLLTQQLKLAEELELPVIIHNRNATQDMIDILKSWHASLKMNDSKLIQHPGVLHSFSADVVTAELLTGLNFKIGITGPVTYHNSQMLQSVVASLPIDSLLIETDAPFLSPQPHRGKRNEPANVRIVVGKIAELKDSPVEMVANITTDTADQLFNWSEIH